MPLWNSQEAGPNLKSTEESTTQDLHHAKGPIKEAIQVMNMKDLTQTDNTATEGTPNK